VRVLIGTRDIDVGLGIEFRDYPPFVFFSITLLQVPPCLFPERRRNADDFEPALQRHFSTFCMTRTTCLLATSTNIKYDPFIHRLCRLCFPCLPLSIHYLVTTQASLFRSIDRSEEVRLFSGSRRFSRLNRREGLFGRFQGLKRSFISIRCGRRPRSHRDTPASIMSVRKNNGASS